MSRLPTHTTPSHYVINYTTLDLEKSKFTGNVNISLDIRKEEIETNYIRLHLIDLHIIKGFLRQLGGNEKTFDLVQVAYHKKDQTCELVFDNLGSLSELEGGNNFSLYLEFQGDLNRQMKGLYRSQYIGLDNTSQVMACTQFEATDARRAFPCFDEPNFKATFELSVTMKSNVVANSNTPVESTESRYVNVGACLEVVKTWKFGGTPKMSTYLLALVVGNFDSISRTSSKSKIQTSVYTVRYFQT